MTNEEYLNNALGLYKSAKTAKVVQRGEETKHRKHEEADLHLEFCKEVRKLHPEMPYIRHERERARSQFSGQLMGKYNSLEGVPDWEGLKAVGSYYGLYIEFKKPGEKWITKDGLIKTDYAHQYNCHLKLWEIGRPAYFCNDLLAGLLIVKMYLDGTPYPKQLYQFTNEDKKKYLVDDVLF